MRRRFWLALMVWLLFGLVAAAPAQAAGSVTYSVWHVDGTEVRVRFMIPMTQAKRLLPDMPRLDSAHVSTAAGPLLSVRSGAGDCTPVVQNQWVGQYYVLAPENDAYRFEMMFQCPTASAIVLRDRVLFDQIADHVDYASVQIGRAAPKLRLFTRGRQDLAIPANGALPAERLEPFARQGLGLLVRDVVAAALICGLLLLTRRWRDLVAIASALSLGYAAALVVVWRSGVAPDVVLAESGMSAAVAILGFCALRRQAVEQAVSRRWAIGGLVAAALAGAALVAAGALKGWPSLFVASGLVVFGFAQAALAGSQFRPRALLFAPALLFGLLDGVVWVQRLAPLQLPGQPLVLALLGYDFGAVAGLVAGAGLAMTLLWIAGRKLKVMQPIGADLAAAALTGLGLFWFVSRLYSV